MNKKILGVRLSTILTVIVCFVAALLLWIYVNFPGESSESALYISDILGAFL